MIELLIVGGIITLVNVLIGTFISLKIQYRHLEKLQAQQEAWQRAQEAHQRTWEVRQGQHALDVEKKLIKHIQDLQEAWQDWQARDEERTEATVQRYDAFVSKMHLEHELASLPRVDETPLPLHDGNLREQSLPGWRPPVFYKTDLSGRDLSYRYLVGADLREAQLVGTNFYMADLSGACLAGANLTNADLSGANLSGADLRNANLSGANLLVADLHRTVLHGAQLPGARNLTPKQVYAALYDSTTRFDEETDNTLPRVPTLHLPMTPEPTTPVPIEASSDAPKLLEAPR